MIAEVAFKLGVRKDGAFVLTCDDNAGAPSCIVCYPLLDPDRMIRNRPSW